MSESKGLIRIKFPVDAYDLKARYAPGLLLVLPILLTIWTCFNSEIKEISNFIGGILSAALVYGLSVIVRGMGQKLELKLKKRWGGFPSTLVVSLGDDTLGQNLKKQYLEAAHKYLKLPIPSLEEQRDNPDKSSRMIEQIFTRIKGVIREKDKHGLWSIALAEYGFVRNLYASRSIWLVCCIIGCGLSGLFLYINFTKLILVGLILNGFLLTGCLLLGWVILPQHTQKVGFRYAENCWESFYNICQVKKEIKRKEGKYGKS